LVLPVLPLHIVGFEITRNGYADGREEVILADGARVKLRVPPGISTAVKLGLTIGQEKGYRNGDLCIDVIDVTR
jgi:hypothetical protein